MTGGEAELLAALEEGRLDPAHFGHEDHVRVAWTLLGPQAQPFAVAYLRLRAGLSALAARAGRAERYSETITLAFLALVHQALSEQAAAGRSFEAFKRAAPELLDPARALSIYPVGVLRSPAARAGLILPGARH